MKDNNDKIINRAITIMGVLLVAIIGLTIYDAIINTPESFPIIIKETTSTINTQYFTNVSDLLYVLNTDNYEIYKK
jgi:hypothetical protein